MRPDIPGVEAADELVAHAALIVVLRADRQGDPVRHENRVVSLGEGGVVRVDPVGGARLERERLPGIDANPGEDQARVRVRRPGLLRHTEEAVLVAGLGLEEIATW